MPNVKGWLLDMYEDPHDGACLWVIQSDGKRQKYHQPFPVRFYISGTVRRLNSVMEYLQQQRFPVSCQYEQKFDIFLKKNHQVLAVKLENPYHMKLLSKKVERKFPDLEYFDTDIPISLRHAAQFNSFPLAKCELQVSKNGAILDMRVKDTPWQIDLVLPKLRIMTLTPDENPSHADPRTVIVNCTKQTHYLSLQVPRSFLINLRALLKQNDPDILLTHWGDTWLLPLIASWQKTYRIPVPLNRDLTRGLANRQAKSYFSYGQMVYHGKQTHLFGRIHIDCCNAMFWKECGLDGILETARVTRLSIQEAARRSSGTGISSMQMIKALENNILIPSQKQQVENAKTAVELLKFDQGGLVYKPLTGVYDSVAEVDFISMYPSIMVRCNISPETKASHNLEPLRDEPGLIPQTLEPLLNKRIELKHRLATMPDWDPRKTSYKQRAAAQKWLLVTCFGYLGYKNARFGRIEAHEAITANGREALLRAKEAAEDYGFTVLHMYVDGLWLKKSGAERAEDYDKLLDEIARRTHLDVALDGIYRWVVFLPSKTDARIPVPNRYFGVFQDGTIKMRGIEARRRDTAPYIASAQMEILSHLAQATNAQDVEKFVPAAIACLQQKIWELDKRTVPLDELLYSQKLSRELNAYRSPSPAARAALQLKAAGKNLKPGQRVCFLYTTTQEAVFAWDLPTKPDTRLIDWQRYKYLLIQAVHTILEPFGWKAEHLNTITNQFPALQTPLKTKLTGANIWQ